MKPIEQLSEQAIKLGMQKYDELMAEANGKYEEAMEVYKAVQAVKEVKDEALKEFEQLPEMEQAILGAIIIGVVDEVNKYLGGNE
ncbi:hypothetical protein ABE236_18205 [Priestia endophytica]|uniref:hypothetical protein n=1 Tax=Priestia endophytica TaxID=135735 RepID=UPI003D2E0AB4